LLVLPKNPQIVHSKFASKIYDDQLNSGKAELLVIAGKIFLNIKGTIFTAVYT